MLKIICLLLILFFKNIENAKTEKLNNPRVKLPLGIIEGYLDYNTVTSSPFYKFEGIPYAKAPVGELRFEEPQDADPWPGVLNTKRVTKCVQYDHFLQNSDKNYIVHGDEDCLHVNVYTPTTNSEENLDVLVHIHGGAFMYGSGASYGPNIILNRNIIFVTINYRLGPLGFLSTEDDVLPGNLGLKDQIKALQWIKANIKNFGGNPDSITLHGLSAGGASVHLHYMLEEPKDLFKRGFSQSGCALNPWILVENIKEKTLKLADLVGCPSSTENNSSQIKMCLKTRSAKDLVYAVKEFQPFLFNPFSPFAVVIDGKWASNPVLKAHPYQLLKQGKVLDKPWIISYTKDEGLYPASDFWEADKNYLNEIDTKWNEIIPFILHYNETVENSEKDKVSQKIRKYYLGNDAVNRKTYSKFVDILSDRLFITDIAIAAELQNAVTKSNIFSYYFTYRGATSKSFARAKTNENIGVSHGDDTIYMFNAANFNTLSTEKDRLMSETLIDMVTSFMHYGSPSISKWKPLSKSSNDDGLLCRLVISAPNNLEMQCESNIGKRDFWYSLPLRENLNLIPQLNNNKVQDEL